MNAPTNPKFLESTASVDEAAIKPLPNSRKVYIDGSRPDIRVPMREISQSDTPLQMSAPAKARRTRRSLCTTPPARIPTPT